MTAPQTVAREAEPEAFSEQFRALAPSPVPTRYLLPMFESQVGSLPCRTRQVLILAALDGTGELQLLQAASGGSRLIDDLEPAENARLVVVDDAAQRLSFRHPLARTAILQRSTSSERRRAHTALAAQLTDRPLMQARHLAKATVGTNEGIAARLEEDAQALLRAGNPVGAISTLLWAAELGAPGAPRSRRLAAAAHISAAGTGRISEVSGLLDQAHRGPMDRSGSLLAAATSAYLSVNSDGDVDTAHRVLVTVLARFPSQMDGVDEPRRAAVGALRYLAHLGARAELWEPIREPASGSPAGLLRNEDILESIAADPVGSTPKVLNELDRMIARLPEEPDVARILSICGTAAVVDRLARCRETLWRVLRNSERSQARGQVVMALGALCHDRYSSGDWDRAHDLADKALQLGESNDNFLYAWLFRYYHALIAAARGESQVADAALMQINQWGSPRGVGLAAVITHHVQSLAALGHGEYEDAYQHAAAISPPGVIRSYYPQSLWTVLDLVEPAIRTGRREEALAHVAATREANVASISPRLELLARASAAITCNDGRTGQLLSTALEVTGADAWPFELARVQLLHGEHLRRSRAATEARASLASALATFERLGAIPWARRASSELRATGLNRTRREEVVAAQLTPQESEIVTLAGAGLTNKQIASRLYMSPRTVGAHLYRAFPKLGVASRAALHEAMATPALPVDR
jgi:ATP/maltotriose-dependent transcriptional regulator MalT